MIGFIERIAARWNYERQQKEWHDYLDRRDANHAEWLREQTATSKARQLAAIARERNALKDELAKVIKAKKARAPIYAALRALSIEELKTENGKK